MNKCTCHHHQTKSKRKADYRFTSALIIRSEWERMTPEEKAEADRQRQAHAEWLVKWDSMSLAEQLQHSLKTSSEAWANVGQQISQMFKPKQPIE